MAQTLEELQKSYDFLLKENETLKSFVKESQTRLSEAEGALSTYENFISISEFPEVEKNILLANQVKGAYGSFESVEKMAEELANFKQLGTLDEVKASLDSLNTAAAENSEYSKLGSVDQVKESLELVAKYEEFGTLDDCAQIAKLVESYKEFGTVADCKEAADKLKEYVDLGTTESLKETKEFAEAVKAYGESVETFSEAADLLKKYVDLGTVSAVESFKESADALQTLGHTVESVKELITKQEEAAKEAEINSLVEKFNITKEAAISTLEMNESSMDKTVAYLESLNLAKPATLIGKKIEVVSESKKSFAKTNETHKTSLYKF